MSIIVIKSNEAKVGFTFDRWQEFLLDSADDLYNLPLDCMPGSKAYLVDNSRCWMMGSEFEWVECVMTTGGSGSVPADVLRYTHQVLNSDQKSQARENIGAADANEVERLTEEIADLKENGGGSGEGIMVVNIEFLEQEIDEDGQMFTNIVDKSAEDLFAAINSGMKVEAHVSDVYTDTDTGETITATYQFSNPSPIIMGDAFHHVEFQRIDWRPGSMSANGIVSLFCEFYSLSIFVQDSIESERGKAMLRMHFGQFSADT